LGTIIIIPLFGTRTGRKWSNLVEERVFLVEKVGKGVPRVPDPISITPLVDTDYRVKVKGNRLI